MLVSTSMATFGLSAAEAGRIANSFVGAADASVASVGDLAQGMANIGPTAAAFGWSLEETNTALAVLSTRGIMGAEAGTALKSMMINLMSPTKDNVRGAGGAERVSSIDQHGAMMPLPNIIGQLSTAMAGMTEEQRLDTIQTLAGSYGQKAMNTLLAEGVPGWNAMATAVANAATAQEMAAARTQGFKAAMEQLRGAIESVFIQVVTPIMQSVLTPFIRLITEAASSVLSLNPALLNAGIAFGAVVAAAGPVLLAIKGIGLVVGALTSPIGLVVLALAALAAAWASDFLGIRTTVTTWWAGVQPQLDDGGRGSSKRRAGGGGCARLVGYPLARDAHSGRRPGGRGCSRKLTDGGHDDPGQGRAGGQAMCGLVGHALARRCARRSTTWWAGCSPSSPRRTRPSGKGRAGGQGRERLVGDRVAQDAHGGRQPGGPGCNRSSPRRPHGIRGKGRAGGQGRERLVGDRVAKDAHGGRQPGGPGCSRSSPRRTPAIRGQGRAGGQGRERLVGDRVAKDAHGGRDLVGGGAAEAHRGGAPIRDKVGQAVKDLATTFTTNWPKMQTSVEYMVDQCQAETGRCHQGCEGLQYGTGGPLQEILAGRGCRQVAEKESGSPPRSDREDHQGSEGHQ